MIEFEPNKRIDSDGNDRYMDSPYEQGGYYCTIGLKITDNPYAQSDEFNHRRFQQGFIARRAGRKG